MGFPLRRMNGLRLFRFHATKQMKPVGRMCRQVLARLRILPAFVQNCYPQSSPRSEELRQTPEKSALFLSFFRLRVFSDQAAPAEQRRSPAFALQASCSMQLERQRRDGRRRDAVQDSSMTIVIDWGSQAVRSMRLMRAIGERRRLWASWTPHRGGIKRPRGHAKSMHLCTYPCLQLEEVLL